MKIFITPADKKLAIVKCILISLRIFNGEITAIDVKVRGIFLIVRGTCHEVIDGKFTHIPFGVEGHAIVDDLLAGDASLQGFIEIPPFKGAPRKSNKIGPGSFGQAAFRVLNIVKALALIDDNGIRK